MKNVRDEIKCFCYVIDSLLDRTRPEYYFFLKGDRLVEKLLDKNNDEINKYKEWIIKKVSEYHSELSEYNIDLAKICIKVYSHLGNTGAWRNDKLANFRDDEFLNQFSNVESLVRAYMLAAYSVLRSNTIASGLVCSAYTQFYMYYNPYIESLDLYREEKTKEK